MLIKTNHEGYYKDSDTGVIVNNDINEYTKFIAQRQQLMEQNGLCKRINELETDLRDIKHMLQQVLLGQKNG